MDIKTTKFTLKNLPPRKSVLIEGNHGLGKSQVVAQTASELSQETGNVYHFIDIRLAEREVGDLIGMPRDVAEFTVTISAFKDGKPCIETRVLKNVSVNDLPSWFPRDPDSYGFLFMDELHYAPKDVLNAAFELSLDYRLNGTPLPMGWRVIAAGNQNQDIYGGTTINPALYSRFLRIEFKPTVPEWLEYAGIIGVHRAITTYVNKFPTDLDSPEKIEPGVIYPDRRAWVSLSDVMKYQAEKGHDPLNNLDYLTLLARGYIGTETTLNFIEYIRKQYKVYTAADILDKLTDEMLEEFKAMQPAEIAFYSNEITSHCKKSKKALSKKQSENLAKWYKAIPKEAASGFWINFVKEVREIAVKWYTDPEFEVKKYTMGFLNKDLATA